MRHIRDGGNDIPLRVKQAPDLHEHRQGIHHVFQHVSQHNHIELLTLESGDEVHLFYVANDHTFTKLGCLRCRHVVDFNPRHRAATLLQHLADVPCGRP